MGLHRTSLRAQSSRHRRGRHSRRLQRPGRAPRSGDTADRTWICRPIAETPRMDPLLSAEQRTIERGAAPGGTLAGRARKRRVTRSALLHAGHYPYIPDGAVSQRRKRLLIARTIVRRDGMRDRIEFDHHDTLPLTGLIG